METFTSVLEFLTYWLVDQYWFPAFLIGSGIFFTIYLGFPQIKYFKHGWRILSGRYVKEDTKGETTPFQALTTAIAAQVGTGNLAGTATAIVAGGPGAIFWMWFSAFFGMSTIFAESILAQKFRTKIGDETVGGPAYYIDKGLGKKKFKDHGNRSRWEGTHILKHSISEEENKRCWDWYRGEIC